MEDDGKGPVEPGAHFYRSYQLDGDGNPINKRNAWQARSVLYVRLIPPGAADVAHYRVTIPTDAAGPITLTAKLNYRKFAHYYTQFAYAGQPKPGQDPRADHADAQQRWSTRSIAANIPANVSGKIKERDPRPADRHRSPAPRPSCRCGGTEPAVAAGACSKQDRERWNDWGIGLLLQGDLKGAEYAFKKVTEAEPGYADGWLNVARALIQEGETEAAKPYIAEGAGDRSEAAARIYFFKAMIEKADGDYDGALASLRTVRGEVSARPRGAQPDGAHPVPQAPVRGGARGARARRRGRSRGRADALHGDALLPRPGRHREAGARGGSCSGASRPRSRRRRSPQRRRMISPEDNNERQQIHEHESVPLRAPRRRQLSAVSIVPQ